MPNLLSRSKHEEFESNLALQIRNQKGRRAEDARKMKQCRRFWAGCRYFVGCEIALCAIVYPAFDFLTSFVPFLFLPILSSCNSFYFWFFFGILYYGLAIKAPRLDTVEELNH